LKKELLGDAKLLSRFFQRNELLCHGASSFAA
jgi:hypothetical protein